MIDDKTKAELELAANWNPPAGLVWRAEPPDRPGWWWRGYRDTDGTIVGVIVRWLTLELRDETAGCFVWAGPIPEPTDAPTDAPDPAAEPVPVDWGTARMLARDGEIDPDEALVVAVEALRAAGDRITAGLVNEILVRRRDDRAALMKLRTTLVEWDLS